jgi:(p)ppGpp synthase/HD superfamily hydrolase
MEGRRRTLAASGITIWFSDRSIQETALITRCDILPSMTTLNETAVPDLATALHMGHVDKARRPCIEQLERVVRILKERWTGASPEEIAAAWLHDASEDTGATPASLLAAGVSPESIRIVQTVTRPPGSVYLEWIARLAASGDRSVIRVKLTNNQDNRDPRRVAELPGAAERVATRYEPARQLLDAALVGAG